MIYEYTSVSVTLSTYGMPVTVPKPAMSAEELEGRYKELGIGDILAVLSLIQPMRSPFPMFKFEARLVPAYRVTEASTTPIQSKSEIEMRCACTVYDRTRPGEPLQLVFTEVAPLGRMTRRNLQSLVRAFLIKCFTHELDEALLVGGVRVFDPHEPVRITGTVAF